MFQLTTANFTEEAPIEELQIASRATNADEWKLYLRWELAYLFTRVRTFDDELLSEILKYSTPHSGSGPPEAAAAAARSYARDCVRQLTALLAESHREFANVIVERTELGRLYKDRATQAKNNRERPRLDTTELSRSLVFSPEDVKALWFPLHFAISGRYFDEDRNSDRYADLRTVLSQTSAWIVREFINLILLGPTDRSASDLAGFDIIARSAESVTVELTRWPEISSSLQKRLDGWQRVLINGNSYPTRDSPQCGHIWENLISKATVMGQSQTPLVTPAPLRPRGSNSPTKAASYEPVASAAGGAAAAGPSAYIPDRSSSYGGPGITNNGGPSKYQNSYDKQIERLQNQGGSMRASSNPVPSNAYTSNTSRRIDPTAMVPSSSTPTGNGGAPGFSPVVNPQSSQNTITAETPGAGAIPSTAGSGGAIPPQSGNFDDYVRTQFDLQDRTIADAVSYFQRERERMLDVKEKLRDLEKQQELLTANYKRQMEDLDRKKREVFDKYQTEKSAPPVNVPAEVVGAMPQSSTVHFALGEADRHVEASQQPGGPSSRQIGHNTIPTGHDYYDDDDEWEREPHPQQRKGSKIHKMHPEFEVSGGGPHPHGGNGGSGGPMGSPEQTMQMQMQQGKGKAPRVSWIQRATHAINPKR
ncbi:hypothetical protein H072_9819 [Dactylellina haptotyla CBS 200.50]|uniref:Uncharacterized protein n=1 Tax=Dactylellina haptotyla (strain CBS 200.50) TaxID=1284197 RepID=S8A639_DACHA|nr:hypothetical protein H072_9819 [Dactylellina haptotyla CBS 200.50]